MLSEDAQGLPMWLFPVCDRNRGRGICRTGLKTVKIGCRVTSIGANAFAQVNNMTGIYVTAMAPPTAENTSFSNYSMPLYVVPGTISLYENASPCWYRFYDEGSISEQTPVTEVTVEDMLLAGAKPGDTFQIKSGVVPAEATLPHLFYVSSNPDVVQVTHEGLVTIMEPQAANDEEIETYSYREPADVEIRVYSMYDDVAPAVIKFDISTGVDDIVIGDASVRLTVRALRGSQPQRPDGGYRQEQPSPMASTLSARAARCRRLP